MSMNILAQPKIALSPSPCHLDHCRFEIMMNCWEEVPEDRPSFSDLVATLSQMMVSEAGYLSLSPDTESVSDIVKSWASPVSRDDKSSVSVPDIIKSLTPPVRRDAESSVPAPKLGSGQ